MCLSSTAANRAHASPSQPQEITKLPREPYRMPLQHQTLELMVTRHLYAVAGVSYTLAVSLLERKRQRLLISCTDFELAPNRALRVCSVTNITM